MNTSTIAAGLERPGAHVQAGGYVDTPTSHALSASVPGAQSAAVSLRRNLLQCAGHLVVGRPQVLKGHDIFFTSGAIVRAT